MDLRVSTIALMVFALPVLSCVATPYEPDETFSADLDAAAPDRQLSEKARERRLYQWTHFALLELDEPRSMDNLWAWWLNLVQPDARLDPGPARRGIVLRYNEATRGVDRRIRSHYVDYDLPPHHLVTSTRFEIVDSVGTVYASGGGAIVCDGRPHVTDILADAHTHVALRYACIPVEDTNHTYCSPACNRLETVAAVCHGQFFTGSP